MERGTERSADILARNPSKMNPLYPGHRIAADAGYKVGAMKETRRAVLLALPWEGDGRKSHRHLAVPDRGAGGEAFGRIDDGIGVDAMVAVEVVDGAGLAEMLDAEGFDPVAAHAAEPTQCRRMAVDHGDDAAIPRQRRQQFLDMAEMLGPAAVAAQLACRGPARMQPVRRGDRQQADIPAAFADQPDRLDRLGRHGADIGDHNFGVRP